MASFHALVLSLLAATELVMMCCDAEPSEGRVSSSSLAVSLHPELSRLPASNGPHNLVKRQSSGGPQFAPCYRQLDYRPPPHIGRPHPFPNPPYPLRPIPRHHPNHRPARLRRQVQPASPSNVESTLTGAYSSPLPGHQNSKAPQQTIMYDDVGSYSRPQTRSELVATTASLQESVSSLLDANSRSEFGVSSRLTESSFQGSVSSLLDANSREVSSRLTESWRRLHTTPAGSGGNSEYLCAALVLL